MLIPFEVLKVCQASAVLLKSESARRMSRLRLLKLLYIADREALTEKSRPITGDRAVAMDHGPVLTQVYDLIKGKDFLSTEWERYLITVDQRDVLLVLDPGVGKLSRYEIGKLQEVAARFKSHNDWAVAEYTHTFPEWVKNQPAKGSRNNIPLDDLLDAVGHSGSKEALLAIGQAESSLKRLISSVK